MVDIEQGPVEACPMAHDFDIRELRSIRAFEALQLLSWN